MMRRGLCRAWLTAAGMLAALQAQALDVLQIVPSDVLGVAVVRSVADSQRQLDALRAQVPLPIPDVAALLREELAEVKGLDWDGRFAVAWIASDEPGGTATVVFVAVRDQAALLESVAAGEAVAGIHEVTVAGQAMQMGFRGEYAVLVEEGDQGALETVLKTPQTLAEPMRPLEARLNQATAYVATTPTGIRMVQQQVLAGLEIARQQAEMMPQGAAGLDMYEVLFASLDQEVTHAMAGLRREEDGSLRVLLGALFAEGGVLAELSQAAEPPEIDLLSGLPATDLVFAAGASLPRAWSPQLLDLSMKATEIYFADERLDEAQRKQLAELNALSFQRVHAMGMLMGLSEPDQPLYGNSTLVMHVDDAPAYIEDYARAMAEMDRWMQQLDDPPFAYTLERLEIAGRPGLRFDMRMEGLLVPDDSAPEVEEMFQAMFGSAEQFSFFMVARDERTVLGTYVSQEPLEKMLGQPGPALDSLAPVARTRTLLPADAQAIGLWSIPGTFAWFRRSMEAVAGEAGIFPIPQFPDSPPIGVGIGFSERCGQADVVLPRELLEAIAAFALEMATEPAW